jgi:hypothetical protein
VRGFHIRSITLTAVAYGTAVSFNRMMLEDFSWMRPVRMRDIVQTFPLHSLMACYATVRTIEFFHENLLQASRHASHPLRAELFPDEIAEF